MRTTRIHKSESLPFVCVRCGQPAASMRPTEFHWEETKEELTTGDQMRMGVGVLLDVASGSGGLSRPPQVRKTLTLDLPFCQHHLQAQRGFLTTALVLSLPLVVGFGLVMGSDNPEEAGHGFWAIVGALIMLAAVVVGMLAYFFRARPLEVESGNDQGAMVTGVADGFVEALLSKRQQATAKMDRPD